MQGLFSLKTAADLREKLRHDLEVLRNSATSSYAAFNFFVTAEQMPDWVYPETVPDYKKLRESVRRGSALLRLCGHLGNGAKHFEVSPRRHGSADSTVVVSTQNYGWRTAYAAGWGGAYEGNFWTTKLVVHLSESESAEFGQSSIEVVELAEKVMRFWDDHPLA